MADFSLFRSTNMPDMTTCENALQYFKLKAPNLVPAISLGSPLRETLETRLERILIGGEGGLPLTIDG